MQLHLNYTRPYGVFKSRIVTVFLPVLLIIGGIAVLTSCGEPGKDDTLQKIVTPVAGHPAYTNPVVKPYTDAIAEDINDADLFFRRGQALVNINCDSLAAIDMERAVTLDTTNIDYLIELGILYNNQDRPQKSIVLFEKAIDLDPHKDAFLGLLQSYIMMRQFGQAEEMLRELKKKIPGDPDFKFLEFEYHLAADKDSTRVVEDMHRFLKVYPRANNIWLQVAELEYDLNDDNAVQSFLQSFYHDTMDAYPLERIGDFYKKNDRLKEALAYYRRAVKADLNYYYGFGKIGDLYFDTDSLEGAIANYRIAVGVNAAYAEGYYGIARVFDQRGQKDSADIYRNIAYRLKPALRGSER